jgi:hypothetical protein
LVQARDRSPSDPDVIEETLRAAETRARRYHQL